MIHLSPLELRALACLGAMAINREDLAVPLLKNEFTMTVYKIPEIDDFYEGLEYEYKEMFLDGTVKTQEEFEKAKWIKAIYREDERPYIQRALYGRNSQNGLCGVRIKASKTKNK